MPDGCVLRRARHPRQPRVRDLADRARGRTRTRPARGTRRWTTHDQASATALRVRPAPSLDVRRPPRARRARTAPRRRRRPATSRGSAARPSPACADHRLHGHRHLGLGTARDVGEHPHVLDANSGLPPMLRSTRSRSVSLRIEAASRVSTSVAVSSSLSGASRIVVLLARPPPQPASGSNSSGRAVHSTTNGASASSTIAESTRGAPARTSGGPRSSTRPGGPRPRPPARAPPPRRPRRRAPPPRRRSHPPAPTTACGATRARTRPDSAAPRARPSASSTISGASPACTPASSRTTSVIDAKRSCRRRAGTRSASHATSVAERSAARHQSALADAGLGHDRHQLRASLVAGARHDVPSNASSRSRPTSDVAGGRRTTARSPSTRHTGSAPPCLWP